MSKDEIEKWADLTYPELVKEVMPLFISQNEIPKEDLNGIVDRAFNKFSSKSIQAIKGDKFSSFYSSGS